MLMAKYILASIMVLSYAGLCIVEMCRKEYSLSVISALLMIVNYLVYFRVK